MCPGEGDGGGGGDSSGGGSTGGVGGDVGAIIDYLNHQDFGTDGDYTGDAGFSGDNTGPPGSTPPRAVDDPASTAMDDLLSLPRDRPGSSRSREGDRPWVSRADDRRDILDAFVAREIDAFTGLPAGFDNPDPFSGLWPSDPFLGDRPMREGDLVAAFDAIRKPSLLSSPGLLADNGGVVVPASQGADRPPGRWQEVMVNKDPGATYHVLDGTDVVQRDTARFSERYHVGGGDQAVIFADQVTKVYTPEKIAKDMAAMDRFDFMAKYSQILDPGTLDKLVSAMPKPVFKPPEPDRQVYMDASGRVGTADDLANRELADQLSDVRPPTLLGTGYGVAAFVLSGGDVGEASRMVKFGDAWAPVFSVATVGAVALTRPDITTPMAPATTPRAPFGENKLRLPLFPGQQVPDRPVEEVFQGFTTRVNARLQEDPAAVASYLTPSQNRFAAHGPWAAKIVYGNALENAMARAAEPTGLLNHTGIIRPFKLGGADFKGLPGTPWAGFNFQVTTEKQWYRHWLNDDPGTIYGLYR